MFGMGNGRMRGRDDWYRDNSRERYDGYDRGYDRNYDGYNGRNAPLIGMY